MIPKLSRHLRRHWLYNRLKYRLRSAVPSLVKLAYGLPTVRLESLLGDPLSLEAPILMDVCMPPYRGTKAHDDLLPMLQIARRIDPRTVLELGTAHGNTVANICKQCPGARVFTVNALAEEQTGHLVSFELSREEIGRVYRKHGFHDRVVQIFCNTLNLDLGKLFNDPVVDLAIIDACHDKNFVVNDFFKVHPFVRAGGVVLFHDTHPSMEDHLVGSYSACMSLRRKGFDIRHIENTWWGIWVKNAGAESAWKLGQREPRVA